MKRLAKLKAEIEDFVTSNILLIRGLILSFALSSSVIITWAFLDPDLLEIRSASYVVIQCHIFMLLPTVLAILIGRIEESVGMISNKGSNPARSQLPYWQWVLALPLTGCLLTIMGGYFRNGIPFGGRAFRFLWFAIPIPGSEQVENLLLLGVAILMGSISLFSIFMYRLKIDILNKLFEDLDSDKGKVVEWH